MPGRDSQQDKEIALLKERKSFVDRIDGWITRAILAALVGGGTFAGGSTLMGPAPTQGDLPVQVAELKRKIAALERRIDVHGRTGVELDKALAAIDQLAIILVRMKGADLAPRRAQRMFYANRAETKYERYLELGVPRDKAIRETLRSMVSSVP